MNFIEHKELSGIFAITPNKTILDFNSLLSLGNRLESLLYQQGALLFRGFELDNPDNFKALAKRVAQDLMSGNGEHDPVPETEGIYTPVAYSPKEKLLWHNENSFNFSWPLMIMFGAARPADEGGETPIVDSRQILTHLDSEIVEEFKCKGVMYVRTHGFGLGRSWQETYGTQNKNELMHKLREADIEFEWCGQNQLITRQIRPAIIKHPVTGELSWFNQAQHWHPYCLKPEVQESLRKIFSEDHFPRHCHFGDGSIIPDDTMQRILTIYQQLEMSFPWQKGDVMMLDNVLFAHARNPYVGERRLLVTMGKKAYFLSKFGVETGVE